MSVEYRDLSVANMDIEDRKYGYKRFSLDNNKLRFSVYTLKQNPFRVATLCLGVLCILLLAGLIGQSVNYRNVQKENENKLKRVNSEKDGLQKSMVSLQRDRADLEEKQRQLQLTYDQNSRRNVQLQNNYNSLTEQYDKIKESERTLKSSNTALTKELQQLNSTTAQLQANNKILSTAKELLQVKFIQAVMLKNTLQASYGMVNEERNNLQNSFNNVTRAKDQLQLSYNRLIMQVETLEKRLDSFNLEKDKMETSHMNTTAAKDALQETHNILVEATEQLNSSYNSLIKEKQDLERSCSEIRAERSKLKETNGNLTAERDQLQLEVTRLNTTIAEKKCPSGWQSFMYSCYYTSTLKKSWKNSRDFCKRLGADLAIVTTQDEMVFINSLYSSDKEVWIGLTDDGIEGNWTWVDGIPLSANATFWGKGQPNSYNGRDQDCVEFWHRKTGSGEWNDENCNLEQYWICEL